MPRPTAVGLGMTKSGRRDEAWIPALRHEEIALPVENQLNPKFLDKKKPQRKRRGFFETVSAENYSYFRLVTLMALGPFGVSSTSNSTGSSSSRPWS